ncbi:TIGR00341 family protein [Halovivax ruber XH-70]|uniref:TIGR00341 family protein n=1 Tax=Halovivax ruber (strain DSM 18193 / JCM 13892 / XH-70) TaxID=797302 RepID=L0I9H0_HALRX|nr:TIGR00341 family protein [Halovivax ruber]AGB15468.1 TIGR00341 family protein [Halovivax ruber XH-70]
MRYVEIAIPEGRRGAVLGVLDDAGINYVMSDETSGARYSSVVRFPVPTNAVEPVLDDLARVDLEDAHVVVVNAETVVSEAFDEVRDQYSASGAGGARTSRQVLRTKADEFTPALSIYLVMLLISAVVATAGLLADSPAVVVGSMVIAPLLGPALAASVGIVTGDDALRRGGFRYQVLGVSVVVLASIGLATLARLAGLEPAGVDIVLVAELEERVSPNLFSVLVALGAGVAGILSLTRGFSEAIVGVMIAAALIPPAAAVGITTAWGMNGAALGALILVTVNLLSINLAALVTLWIAGYRPQGLFEVSPTRRATMRYIAVFGVGLLVLAVPLAGLTLNDFQTTELEATAQDEVERILDDPQYNEVTNDDVTVVLDDDYPARSVERVIVVVKGFDPGPDPELSDRIYQAISEETDASFLVEVQYVVAEERGETGEERIVRTAGADG